MRGLLFCAWVVAGCGGSIPSPDASTDAGCPCSGGWVCRDGGCVDPSVDMDGDGFTARIDCDDTDPTVGNTATGTCTNAPGCTASNTCTNGEWSACPAPECTLGDTQPCGAGTCICGTQACGADCRWGACVGDQADDRGEWVCEQCSTGCVDEVTSQDAGCGCSDLPRPSCSGVGTTYCVSCAGGSCTCATCPGAGECHYQRVEQTRDCNCACACP